MRDIIIKQREQLQEDLRCILDGVDDSFLDNVCQVVVDRMNILIAEAEQKKAGVFSDEEQTVVLELARLALADAETYDDVADKLDLSDEFLKPLQEKITEATK